MNHAKAISLLQMQLDKLDPIICIDTIKDDTWRTQNLAYLKDIFGVDSLEFLYMKAFRWHYPEDGIYWEKYSIERIPEARKFLENCIETIEHKGLPKKAKSVPEGKWQDRHPLIFALAKAILVLFAGYAFRYFTEPKGNLPENKTGTQQIQDTLNKRPTPLLFQLPFL